MTDKPKRGRPPLPEGEAATHPVLIGLNDEDHERLKTLAVRDESKPATVAKKAVRQYLDRRGV